SPEFVIDCGADHKSNLLKQASRLEFYKRLVECDANRHLPFEDGEFRTVFSNILYWLDDPETALKEIARICSDRAILCMPTTDFYAFCPSYSRTDGLWSLIHSRRHVM